MRPYESEVGLDPRALAASQAVMKPLYLTGILSRVLVPGA